MCCLLHHEKMGAASVNPAHQQLRTFGAHVILSCVKCTYISPAFTAPTAKFLFVGKIIFVLKPLLIAIFSFDATVSFVFVQGSHAH